MPEVSVALLPGDGSARKARRRRATWSTPWRGSTTSRSTGTSTSWAASIDPDGTALTDEVLDACRASDAVFLGAVGGPKSDTTNPTSRVPSRPARPAIGLGIDGTCGPCALARADQRGPLRRERIEETDLLVVRELTGGLLLRRARRSRTAPSTPASTPGGGRCHSRRGRLPAAAAGAARPTSVDKANVLETSRLWREKVIETATGTRTSTSSTCSWTTPPCSVGRPADFDVIVTGTCSATSSPTRPR